MSYNGLEWDFHSLTKDSSAKVVSLAIDNDGSIYACTIEGISKYSLGSWKKLELNLEFGDSLTYYYNRIPAINSLDGSIWIGTKQGALRIKDDKMALYRPNIVSIDFNDSKDSVLNSPDFDIYNIFEDNSGKLWFALRDGRVYRCKFDNRVVDPRIFE